MVDFASEMLVMHCSKSVKETVWMWR